MKVHLASGPKGVQVGGNCVRPSRRTLGTLNECQHIGVRPSVVGHSMRDVCSLLLGSGTLIMVKLVRQFWSAQSACPAELEKQAFQKTADHFRINHNGVFDTHVAPRRGARVCSTLVGRDNKSIIGRCWALPINPINFRNLANYNSLSSMHKAPLIPCTDTLSRTTITHLALPE